MPPVSRAQHRWMWATNQPFAERWATRGRYRQLPERVEAKAEKEQAAPVGRKPMNPQERARHAALVRWGKKNPLAARVMALREKRKAKGAAAPKPDKAQAAAENRAKAYEALGLFEDATAALDALRKGEPVDDDGGLVKLGLAEQGADGTYRLTPAGRALHAAATRGDVGAAKDTLSRAKDKVAGREASLAEQAAAGLDKKQPAGSLAEQATGGLSKKEPAPEKKKGSGGGGGGGKEEKPDKAAEAAQRTTAALDAVGLKPGDLDALRAAAEGGDVDEAQIDGLAEQGLVEPDGKGGFITTDQGRRALRALERGDVRGYRAALQDVGAARGRAQERKERRAAQDEARAGREAQRQARDAERRSAQEAREQAQRDREAQALDDLADDFRRGRRGLSFAEQRKLIRAGRARLNGETFELKTEPEVKHGKHNQASHGRRTARRGAAQSAYRGARAAGASPQEARAVARDASEVFAARQRLANIEKQLGGAVTDRTRASLEAERARLTQDIDSRVARLRSSSSQAMAGGVGDAVYQARNASVAPTVSGRRNTAAERAQAAQATQAAQTRQSAQALAAQHGLPAGSARYLEMMGSDPLVAQIAGQLHAANQKLRKRDQPFRDTDDAGAVAIATQIARQYGSIEAAMADPQIGGLLPLLTQATRPTRRATKDAALLALELSLLELSL